jgi:hypothetical protein
LLPYHQATARFSQRRTCQNNSAALREHEECLAQEINARPSSSLRLELGGKNRGEKSAMEEEETHKKQLETGDRICEHQNTN